MKVFSPIEVWYYADATDKWVEAERFSRTYWQKPVTIEEVATVVYRDLSRSCMEMIPFVISDGTQLKDCPRCDEQYEYKGDYLCRRCRGVL